MRTPDGAVHEQVIVHEGDGNLAEMTRAAALDFYAERRDVPAKANDGGATKPLPKTLDATANDTAAPPPAAASPTPLLEIRETCDAAGAIVSSEVVNITNTVQRLGESLQGVADAAGNGQGADERLGGLLAQTLKEGERDIVKDAHRAPGAAETATNATTDPPHTKKAVGDEEYAALCARLDELAKLEEEEARSRRESVDSSRRLQSAGWSTGFLNGSKKKQGAAAKRSAPARAPPHGGGGEGSAGGAPGAGPARPSPSSTPGDAAARTPKTERGPEEDGAGRTVSFSEDPQVQEIPRIGRCKVPPRPSAAPGTRNTGWSTGFLNGTKKVAAPRPAATPAVPFEERVFRGVVKERAADDGEVVRQATAYRHSAKGSVGADGEKKLSRFAQQRLQREGNK